MDGRDERLHRHLEWMKTHRQSLTAGTPAEPTEEIGEWRPPSLVGAPRSGSPDDDAWLRVEVVFRRCGCIVAYSFASDDGLMLAYSNRVYSMAPEATRDVSFSLLPGTGMEVTCQWHRPPINDQRPPKRVVLYADDVIDAISRAQRLGRTVKLRL